MLLLSNEGWKVAAIAKYRNCAYNTVRQTYYRWLTQGKEGLFDAPRSGRKPRLNAEDIKYLEECLEKDERTYNSRQLVEKLKQERSVEISRDRLRKILKKKDWRWKRTKMSLKGKQNPREFAKKKKDLETLKQYEEAGYIKLKYLDEAGFCCTSPVSYSYSKKGEQKTIEQPKKRGRRLSVLGILSEKENFEYGLKIGSFKSKSYLEIMNWQAEKAAENLKKNGQITIMVLDNYTVHKSQEVQKNWEKWREKGLEFFFISADSPELNLIEPEWHQLKAHEISGRMFDDEYELAIAVMEAIETRSKRHNYSCERFRFN